MLWSGCCIQALAPSGSSLRLVIGPRGWLRSPGGIPNMRLLPRVPLVGYNFRPHSRPFNSNVGHGDAELKPGIGSSERSLKRILKPFYWILNKFYFLLFGNLIFFFPVWFFLIVFLSLLWFFRSPLFVTSLTLFFFFIIFGRQCEATGEERETGAKELRRSRVTLNTQLNWTHISTEWYFRCYIRWGKTNEKRTAQIIVRTFENLQTHTENEKFVASWEEP